MKYVSYLFFIFSIISCNSSDNRPRRKQPKKLISTLVDSVSREDSISVAKLIEFQNSLITNENVTEKLTEFGLKNPETKIKIKTRYGSIKIKLYKDTPLHRANFIMLIKKNYFDSTLFYRVIDNFMIQGGNSDTDDIGVRMKNIGIYSIPEEMKKHHIHKRGALAMAVRDQSEFPKDKRHHNSSAYNFYIIQKGPLKDSYMDKIEKRYKITIPKENRAVYRKLGGSPHLDNQYTVFGEVYSGFKTIDKISKVLIDAYDRPKKNIFISVEIID